MAETQDPNAQWKEWMRAFGRQERRIREFLGLSQEQIARLAGVSQGAVSRLEAGRGLAFLSPVKGWLRNGSLTNRPSALSSGAVRAPTLR